MSIASKTIQIKPTDETVAKLRAWCNRAASTPAPEPEVAPEIGDKMPDGSIFAGLSPDTGKPMFAMPTDARATCDFNKATQYKNELNGNKTFGHDDWRLPSIVELKVLFENQDKGALKETFNYHTRQPINTCFLYWSASCTNSGWSIAFNGDMPSVYYRDKTAPLSVRCIR